MSGDVPYSTPSDVQYSINCITGCTSQFHMVFKQEQTECLQQYNMVVYGWNDMALEAESFIHPEIKPKCPSYVAMAQIISQAAKFLHYIISLLPAI
jgi:hypothetical protein